MSKQRNYDLSTNKPEGFGKSPIHLSGQMHRFSWDMSSITAKLAKNTESHATAIHQEAVALHQAAVNLYKEANNIHMYQLGWEQYQTALVQYQEIWVKIIAQHPPMILQNFFHVDSLNALQANLIEAATQHQLINVALAQEAGGPATAPQQKVEDGEEGNEPPELLNENVGELGDQEAADLPPVAVPVAVPLYPLGGGCTH